ncbi:universal stress protein [Aminobacter sp. HY435]|uniref:universal stress protein n=1 Tax=Aminobacter sp. HY435 TaxID=2970917 RepID=UPI0022B9A4D4|nr:universal stress protein [Aminobacter sp. HY435]
MKQQFFLPLATYPEANSEAVAVNAMAIAAQLGGRLRATAFNPDIPQVSNALSKLLLDTPQMIRDAEATSRKRGKDLLAAVEAEAAKAKVEVEVSEMSVPLAAIGEAACDQARYFDMALLGWESGNDTARMLAEAVVFGSGRPALILPGAANVPAIGHVAIAWDGSRVAARAVADARPFLQKASRVSVITVVNEKKLRDTNAAEKLAKVLTAGGVEARAVFVELRDSTIGETLQETAKTVGADLLVMGGYGHSRVRDFVLGGATAGVLGELRLSVLLSH